MRLAAYDVSDLANFLIFVADQVHWVQWIGAALRLEVNMSHIAIVHLIVE